jgi:hypothetical protein
MHKCDRPRQLRVLINQRPSQKEVLRLPLAIGWWTFMILTTRIESQSTFPTCVFNQNGIFFARGSSSNGKSVSQCRIQSVLFQFPLQEHNVIPLLMADIPNKDLILLLFASGMASDPMLQPA